MFDDDTLLDAASTELLTHGFERLTMDAVALRCGTTKQTLYARHGDKARLVAAVGERARRRIRGHLVDAYRAARGRSLRHQLRAGMHALASFARAHPDDFQVLTNSDWPGRHALAETLQLELTAEIVLSLRDGNPDLSDEVASDVASLVVSLGWNAATLAHGADPERVDRLAALATTLAADGMAPFLAPGAGGTDRSVPQPP